LIVGCPENEGLPPGIVPTDQTNYIGSAACSSCHASVASSFSTHGHSQALKAVLDGGPTYPSGAAGVPAPPVGFDWPQISYVIGGYEKAARFVDINGYVITDGTAGTNTQYNQAIPAIGLAAGFVPFMPAQATPLPYAFDDFSRRTTGPLSLADNGNRRQDNRPGIEGTWAQPGVQCEACHGPGSMHVPNPSAGNIQLDADSASCARCHAGSAGATTVTASDGLLGGFQQTTELAVSPHAGFSCTVCHDPHTSAILSPSTGIRNACQVCHPTTDMAVHQGKVYQRGSYSEPVTCVSCHMPYVVQTLSSNDLALTNGRTVRLGDTRSHVFILNTTPTGQTDMFTAGGTQLAVDAEGRASISTCYVCQRCHNGLGNAFAFPPSEGCAFGGGIHVSH
jgi:hypothetical protein